MIMNHDFGISPKQANPSAPITGFKSIHCKSTINSIPQEEIGMATEISHMTLRRSRPWIAFAAALFVLFSMQFACAQVGWTAGDTKNAWNGYLTAYQYTGAAGYDYLFATNVNGSTHGGFWTSAELIDMAVDAYVWAKTNDSANLSTYENEVEGLCDGFVSLHPDSEGGGSWASEDEWNDDLNVATIAFTRAYGVTGTSRWLTDAEDSFNAVWVARKKAMEHFARRRQAQAAATKTRR
jgi:hypothetical protein